MIDFLPMECILYSVTFVLCCSNTYDNIILVSCYMYTQ